MKPTNDLRRTHENSPFLEVLTLEIFHRWSFEGPGPALDAVRTWSPWFVITTVAWLTTKYLKRKSDLIEDSFSSGGQPTCS